MKAGRKWVALLAAMVCGAAGCREIWQVPEPLVAVVEVTVRDFPVLVTATGEMEAIDAVPVAVPRVSPVALRVKRIKPSGAQVKKGDVLLVFDDSRMRLDLTSYRAMLHDAASRRQQTRLDWLMESGSIELMQELSRIQRDQATRFALDDEALFSRLELLRAGQERELSQQTILFAEAKLALRGEYFDLDAGIQSLEEERLQAEKGEVERSLAELVLRAPQGGLLLHRKNGRAEAIAVGDSLWPGNVAFSLVDPTRTRMRVLIFERDAAGVVPGATARVRLDAYPGRIFLGRVGQLSRLARALAPGSPIQVVEATVEIDDGELSTPLRPGMQGRVEIELARVDGALVIPRVAVGGPPGEEQVVVKTVAGTSVRRVRLGPGDAAQVVVTEGLTAGERIIVGGNE